MVCIYYCHFKRLWKQAFIIYLIAIFNISVMDYFSGAEIGVVLKVAIISMCCGPLITALPLWIMTRVFPVYVKKEGLRSYNIFAFYRTVPWNEIDKIRPINFLGLRYIRVGSIRGGAPIWIPMFLDNVDGFIESVEYFGGDASLFEKFMKK